MGEVFGVVADDEASDVDARGLEVCGEGVKMGTCAAGDAVIAYEGVSEDEDLALV